MPKQKGGWKGKPKAGAAVAAKSKSNGGGDDDLMFDEVRAQWATCLIA